MAHEQGLTSAPSKPEVAAPAVPLDHHGIEGTPSRWLALAFVALLSALVLLGTTGIGAAASRLLGDQPASCGEP
jgi:hypothetical protein